MLAVATALLLSLAYQFPLHSGLPTDGLGDQPFLGTTEALAESATTLGMLYPDEMDAAGRRFRWTRGRALLTLPAVGGGRGYRLTVTAEGWPADVLRRDLAQPYVHVLANGQPVGVFTPTSAIADYALDLPPSPQATLMLDLQLSASPTIAPLLTQTASFTGTSQYLNDNRPHGLRLYGVALDSAGGSVVRPDLATVLQALLAVLLVCLAVGPQRRRVAWVAGGALLAFGLALLVVVDRLWLAPLLGLLLPLLGLLLLWRWRRPLVRALADWQRRAVDSGAFTLGLTGAALLLLLLTAGPALARGLRNLASQVRLLDPGAIIVASLLCSLLMLLLLRWSELNRLLDRLNRRLRTRPRLGWLLLGAIVLIWLGFGWTAIRSINYLGNADYSDNGVVARNLVAGRGWVVDYVTQFYRLNPGGSVTRVQETWPLLQPVWIAPFFALFGPTAWAARIPNLIFFTLLAVIVYQIASTLWDRRVGLVAVLLVLINKHMFRLLIYSTSDLGFVVLYAAALWLLWRAIERGNRRLLLASGLLVGLMCWQKTSAVVVAAGMGLWLIWRAWHSPRDLRRRVFVMITLYWILPAALVLSPFVVRNLHEFGQPAFSTESYDAWLLEYQGTSTGDFESIYRIYTNEGGLPGSGGLPDASWIKRWGYQRTLNKITRQLAAVRDYLLPASPALGPLSGKGAIMGNLGADNETPFQWLMLGSLLSLVGALTLRRRQARLMQLVLVSFAPYTVFLALYWHANEERYFVPLIPFLALLAAGALWRIHDAIAKAGHDRGRPLALLALGALLVLALRPGWVEAADKTSTAPISNYADWQADIAAFEWLKANTPPDAVVMTRVPWQLNFHAERPAVMNPNTADLDSLLRIAQYYQARYLLVNAQTNNKDAAAIALRDLLQGREVSNFKRVAQFDAPRNRTIYIYEFPADYNGVAPVTMSIEQ
jgi:4-amino-4-deoxy-L-arabinose transferase-like glycosyltransferase